MDETRRTSFDRNAARYDAVRPAYPDAAIDVLVATGAKRVVEIGAGTGKATVLVARRGLDLTALEPGEQLAAVLRANIAAFPNVSVEQTTFEAWPGADGTFDLVFAAQAFHWVDPQARYVKSAAALRPGGTLAVITNEKAAFEATFRAEADAAYARWFGWAPYTDTPQNAEDGWTTELAASARFTDIRVARIPWTATYSSRQYVDLIDTYSDHAVRPEAERRGLYDQIREAIDRRGGAIEIPYLTLVITALTEGTAR